MTYIVPKKVYYIHIPKTGGTTEKYSLIEKYGDEFQEVPTGKHSPYDEMYKDYDCIYTHVRNPHNRMLSMYLFYYELQYMPQKYISPDRIEFQISEHKQTIGLNATELFMKNPSKFDKMLFNKLNILTKDPNTENYCRWLEIIGKANKEMDEYFVYRPWLQQNLWIKSNVVAKKIEDENYDIHLNTTTRMPEHSDSEYIDAGKTLIEDLYKEDFDLFNY